MIDKFALFLCPEKGCPKIGLGPGSKCPTHNKDLIRTVVMTEAAARKLKPPPPPSDLLGDLFGGRRR